MSIEAMRQALDLLANKYISDKELRAITALRQAIAQAEKQQALDKKADNARELGLDYEPDPVAYIDHVSGKPKFINGYVVQTDYDIPLYTTPPRKKWVGLTDDDLRQIILVSIGVAEAKLKVKNNGN